MLLGIGILDNSLIYVLAVVPVFIFIYQAIILAEENFLRGKFGSHYNAYWKKVNRWLINFKGIGNTFRSMKFNWRRWILKEHTTQFIWLSGIVCILLVDYPELTNYNERLRNSLIIILLAFLLLGKWFGQKGFYRRLIVLPLSVLIILVAGYWTIGRIFYWNSFYKFSSRSFRTEGLKSYLFLSAALKNCFAV